MRIIHAENPQVHVLFEHRSELISDSELAAYYAWCGRLLDGELQARVLLLI